MPDNDPSTQLALLVQEVRGLASATQSNHAEIKSILQDHETRIRFVEGKVTEISARQTMLTMIQSAFTTIAATVAALVGRS